ncbi:MAG TPA: type III pantothenate kinase [Usitatibacter sp.]|nr:type III pantothenate kinase [Usitatibacter sp.]
MQVLAVDAGNTRIKWGVRSEAEWQALGTAPTADHAKLADAWRKLPPVQKAIASNVAGRDVESALQRACAAKGIALQLIRSERSQLGVTNEYAEPSQLGSDRWAALIAAHHARKGHKLVVNAGTALTVDALTAGGQFLGGLIVPGPALMRRSLDRGTAGLRLTEGHFTELPRSTPDAITTGAVFACAGAVRQLADAMARAGSPPEAIILSGGAAGEIAAHLPIAPTIHENLVLEGLVLIARNA